MLRFQVITEYENLIRDIERLKNAIEKAKSNQDNLDNEMDSVFKKWSETITNVVTEINRNFSNFMMLMGFAGEVQLTCLNEVCKEKGEITKRHFHLTFCFTERLC